MWQYRCLDCGADFMVEPNRCRACGSEIADGAEYCDFHATHGFDDGVRDRFAPPGVCLKCGARRTYKFFEYCKECLEEEDPDWREKYSRDAIDEEDDDELITDLWPE